MTHLHMLLFLLLVQLRYYFCTDLPSFIRSFVMIVHTLLEFMPNSFAIILTIRQQSPYTFRQTSSIFSSALLVAGLAHLRSSSTSSLLNLLCHAKARPLDTVSSPYTFCSSLSACVVVFPSRTRSFKLVCSVVIEIHQKLRTEIFTTINVSQLQRKACKVAYS